MIVAIAGPIGVGKSTVARLLAQHLGYRYISGGEVFREIAQRRGISVTEVNKLAEGDPSLDRELDRRQRELAQQGDCVVESRLSGWMVDADLKVWLKAPLDVRAERTAGREGQPVSAARADLAERERSEWSRYKEFYGIDVGDLTPYHLVIDTTRWSAEAIAEAVAMMAKTAKVLKGSGARGPGPGMR